MPSSADAQTPREDTRDRILSAGMELLHRQGYNGTGLAEILSAAGVPKGSFYHFFKSKEDFALCVVERIGQGMLERTRALLRQDGRSPGESLRQYLDALLARFCGADPRARSGCPIGNLVQELAHQHPQFQALFDALLRAMEEELTLALERAKAAGEAAPDLDPGETARFCMSSWQGAILRSKAAGGDEAPLRRAHAFLLRLILGKA